MEEMNERRIRNSAKALIVRDGRIAAIRIRHEGREWFIMPGGGQEPGETLAEAVVREVREELGLLVEPRELLLVAEGPHRERFHRVDHVFLCTLVGEAAEGATHSDTDQAGVEWLEVARLDTLPLYPLPLRREIMRFCAGEPHCTYLGNTEGREE